MGCLYWTVYKDRKKDESDTEKFIPPIFLTLFLFKHFSLMNMYRSIIPIKVRISVLLTNRSPAPRWVPRKE